MSLNEPTPDVNQLSNRDIILEMRSDIKSIMLGHAVLGERVTATKATVDELEQRVEAISMWRSRVMGYGAAIIFVAGLIASFARDAIAAALHLGR